MNLNTNILALVGKANRGKKKGTSIGTKTWLGGSTFQTKKHKVRGHYYCSSSSSTAAVGHLGLLGTGPRHVDSFNPTTPVWVGDDSPLLKPIAQS